MKPPYHCLFCGAPSWREPCEQTPPPDCCHEEDHGSPEEYLDMADEVGCDEKEGEVMKPNRRRMA